MDKRLSVSEQSLFTSEHLKRGKTLLSICTRQAYGVASFLKQQKKMLNYDKELLQDCSAQSVEE